jgi:hypothetical protein
LANDELVRLLNRAPGLLDQVLKEARRNNRMRRCLSSARYYSGLNSSLYARIDGFLRAPFPAASGPPSLKGRR